MNPLRAAYITVHRLAHYLWGLLTALAAMLLPQVIPAIMFIGFVIYELDEEWHIRDRAYHDIREYLVGLGVGVVVDAIVKTVCEGL